MGHLAVLAWWPCERWPFSETLVSSFGFFWTLPHLIRLSPRSTGVMTSPVTAFHWVGAALPCLLLLAYQCNFLHLCSLSGPLWLTSLSHRGCGNQFSISKTWSSVTVLRGHHVSAKYQTNIKGHSAFTSSCKSRIYFIFIIKLYPGGKKKIKENIIASIPSIVIGWWW